MNQHGDEYRLPERDKDDALDAQSLTVRVGRQERGVFFLVVQQHAVVATVISAWFRSHQPRCETRVYPAVASAPLAPLAPPACRALGAAIVLVPVESEIQHHEAVPLEIGVSKYGDVRNELEPLTANHITGGESLLLTVMYTGTHAADNTITLAISVCVRGGVWWLGGGAPTRPMSAPWC